jgi:tRNA pseudouridine32 synthase / 23S rRNA pseudouridine746 synthase
VIAHELAEALGGELALAGDRRRRNGLPAHAAGPSGMTHYAPPQTRLGIVHADDFLIAVDKPSGLLSVPGRGEDKADCALSRAQEIYPDALTVHRLDMATSGLLLLARGKEMQRALSGLFERGEVPSATSPMCGACCRRGDQPRSPGQKVDHEIGPRSTCR